MSDRYNHLNIANSYWCSLYLPHACSTFSVSSFQTRC